MQHHVDLNRTCADTNTQGVEAPTRVANLALQFFGNDSDIPSVDLSWLEYTIVSVDWILE